MTIKNIVKKEESEKLRAKAKPKSKSKAKTKSKTKTKTKTKTGSSPGVEPLAEETPVEKLIEFCDLEGKFLHIRVGDASETQWRESTFCDREVRKVEDKILELLERNEINCLVFVTHYAVEINIIEPQHKLEKGKSGTLNNAK